MLILLKVLKKTIDRVQAYEDAGADIIFPEAMKDEKEFELIRKNLKVNLLANMTEFGKSKLLSANTIGKFRLQYCDISSYNPKISYEKR